ncbi:MAG: PIN domain-containing protein [Pyrinomonadaceae bacterium]
MMANKQATFVDAMVLIYAARGQDIIRKQRALFVLADPDREFIASEYLRLEVLPQAIRYKWKNEQRFYERFFLGVSRWVDGTQLLSPAFDIACRHGVGAMDALHIAAALLAGAEFVTAERPTKPIYQAYTKVVSIY